MSDPLDKMAENARELGIQMQPEEPRAWFTVAELNAWADKKLEENPHWAEQPAQPAQQEPVGEVYRHGKDSHGRQWHGIHWYDANVDVPTGTKLYTSPQPSQQQEPVAWMSNKDFEPIRRRIMAEAYELAERDVEGYNAIKVLCSDIQKMLPAQQQEPVLQDIEQYRLQMAGISTAAIGYWKEGDGIHPDYDTVALRDVAKLYAKYDELYKAQPAQPSNPSKEQNMKILIEMADEIFDRQGPDIHCRESYWTATDAELERFADLVRADEREACAKVCDDAAPEYEEGKNMAVVCATAIRARSNT